MYADWVGRGSSWVIPFDEHVSFSLLSSPLTLVWKEQKSSKKCTYKYV